MKQSFLNTGLFFCLLYSVVRDVTLVAQYETEPEACEVIARMVRLPNRVPSQPTYSKILMTKTRICQLELQCHTQVSG